MTFQYALRFESGERRGEVIPLTIVSARGGVFTIGRQPGNSLQVVDASVSGRHAELEVGPDGLSIRDLDSTNGTEVAGRRVRQTSLEMHDEFVLGKVQFTVVDAASPSDSPQPDLELEPELELELESPATDDARLSQTRIQPRDESFEITAEDIARSRHTSRLAPIGLLALAVLAGAAWFWSRSAGEDSGDSSLAVDVAAVDEPAGNLLRAGYSFEKTEGWSSIEGDGDRFDLLGSAAATGRRGARAELYGGEYAQLVSDPVRAEGSHKVIASVLVDGDARARVGVQFSASGSSTDEPVMRPVTIWSDWADVDGNFSTLEFPFTAPAGTNGVAVVLWAQSTAPAQSEGGDAEDADLGEYSLVDFDDVALVPDGAGAPLLSDASWRLHSIARTAGAPGRHRALAVTSLEDTMIAAIRLRRSAAEGQSRDLTDFSVKVEGASALITASAAGSLEFRLADRMVEAGLATISGGTDGGRAATYASHGTVFEASGASTVLLGSDARLVSVALPSLRAVTCKPQAGGATIRFEVSVGETVRLQFDFSEERTRAQRLARQAREARSNGASGDALRIYGELLRECPFDSELIHQAGTALDEITAIGRQELKGLSAELERARFFGLGDLYREKLAKVQTLRGRYEGTAVAPACEALAAEIETELSKLGSDTAEDDAKRLEAVASALRAQGSEGLASRVEQYMTKIKAEGPVDPSNSGGDR